MQAETLPVISNSGLTKFKNWLYGIHQDPNANYFNLGNIFDAALTEPEKVNLTLGIYEGVEISKEDLRLIKAMHRSFSAWLKANQSWMNIISMCKSQHIVRAEKDFEINGITFSLLCTCKYDLFIPGKIGIDIKTTEAKTMKDFISACEFMDYDRSRAFYANTSGVEKDYIIGVSKVYPHNVFVVDSKKQGWIDRGTQKMNDLILQYFLYCL